MIRKQFQPKTTYFAPGVAPLAKSNIVLPGGKEKPHYYCLGVDSTIPFVSLLGGGASQKIISWGEMIEVLPGQTVTVKNESYMQGDIVINSGHDFAAKPERISLPVTTKTENFVLVGVPVTRISSLFPADTRRCRRAYLRFQIQTGADALRITFTGKPQRHSFPGVDLVTGQQTYTQEFNIPPVTVAGGAPMGYGASLNSLEPMALTDQVHWNILFADATPPTFLNTLFMYSMEY